MSRSLADNATALDMTPDEKKIVAKVQDERLKSYEMYDQLTLKIPVRKQIDDPQYRGKDYLVIRGDQLVGCIRVPSEPDARCQYKVVACNKPDDCETVQGANACTTISGEGFFGITCKGDSEPEVTCNGASEQSKLSFVGVVMTSAVYLGDDMIFDVGYKDPMRQSFKLGADLCNRHLPSAMP